MLKKLVNRRELKRFYEMEPQRCVQHLTESLESGALRTDSFSVRDLFVSLIEGGEELLDLLSYRKTGGSAIALREAAQAVDTSAFSNITGQLVFNRVKEKYNDPSFLWPELCDSQQTNFLDGERIPGIGRIGDKAEVVGQGEKYPTHGLNEEYVDTVPLVKRGDIVPVTREIIVADRTGLLLKMAGELGYWLGVNTEKRAIDLAIGTTNNYKRNGTSTNTYLTAGAYVNSQANTLVDWTDIENAELLFDAMTDPNTGEPIIMTMPVVIVPSALKQTAKRILHATEVMHVDNQANAATIRTGGANPIDNSYKLITGPLIKARTGNGTTWFMGDPKRAFCRMYAWDIETMESGTGSEAWFMQDIWVRYKATVMDAFQVLEPRYMVKNT